MVEKHARLRQALAAIDSFTPPGDDVYGVFRVTGAIGGPQGELPLEEAIFGITPPAAALLEELAVSLQEAEAKYSIMVSPTTLGVRYSVGKDRSSDTPDRASAEAITWVAPDRLAEAVSIGRSCGSDLASADFIVSAKGGDVWLHLDFDGPSTADVLIDRDILHEIGAGPDDGPGPSL